MSNGWITLDRKITEWEWYQDTNTFRVFIHLLLKANYEDKKYMGFLVKRGSLVLKQTELGEQISLTRRQVRTSLDKLKSTGVIQLKTTNKFTIVTIVNYSNYQDISTIKRTTNDNQMTIKCTTNDNQMASLDKQINNITNISNDRENIISSSFCQEENKENFIKFYLNNINPTASSFELEKLSSIANDIEEDLIKRAIEIAILNNKRRLNYIIGILNNWIDRGIKTLEQWEALEKINKASKEVKEIKKSNLPPLPEMKPVELEEEITEEDREWIINNF